MADIRKALAQGVDPLAEASMYANRQNETAPLGEQLKYTGQLALESLPGVGTAFTLAELEEELSKEEPDYIKVGMLVGSEAAGLIPGLGSAAKSMIRKGADMARQTDDVVDVVSNIPQVSRKDADVLQAENLLDDPDALKAWQEENKLPETQRQTNPEDAKLAANELFEGEITSQEARKRIRNAIPDPQEYTAEQVMEMMPTVTEVTGSLGKKAGKYGILGVKGFDLKEGQKVSSRLDIPAYNNYNTWVVSIHDGTKDAGLVEGFGQAVRLKNIEFKSNVGLPAIDIARGKRFVKATGEDAPKPQGKATIARIFGEYTSEDPYDLQRQAADIIASGSEEWTQVGMNPYRGSAFYDKKTGMPVFEADEVIQVGPLVLAKNVKKPTISQMKEMAVRTRDGKLRMFNEGGMTMYNEGGAVPDNTVGVDPVSGNEVPIGSLPEEVRDDIPAQLSEGEYVVPADVVRYYGVKFFEDLRAEAKQGWAAMEANGRVGGEPVEATGMEMGQDELPFDISELQVVEMNEGGYLGGYDEGGDVNNFDTPSTSPTGNPFATNTISTKKYVDDQGNVRYVTFSGDTPLSYIPPEFKLEGTQEEEPTTEAAPVQQDNDDGVPVDKEYLKKISDFGKFDPTTAAFEDYQKEIDKATGAGGTIASGLIGATVGPLVGYGVSKLIDRDQKKKLENLREQALDRASEFTSQEADQMADFQGLADDITNILEGKETKTPFGQTLLGDLIGWGKDNDIGLSEENKGKFSGMLDSFFDGLGTNRFDAMYRDDDGNVNVSSDVAQADWIDSIAAVEAANASDDPAAWTEAIQAQSAASRAATEAIQAETGWTGFFSPPETPSNNDEDDD